MGNSPAQLNPSAFEAADTAVHWGNLGPKGSLITFQDQWQSRRMCNGGNRCCIRLLSPVLPCAGRHFQFIRVGPTPAGCHPGAHLCQTFVQQRMEVLGRDERWYISSRQRHGGPGLARSAVPMRAGAGNGVTTGASVGCLKSDSFISISGNQVFLS